MSEADNKFPLCKVSWNDGEKTWETFNCNNRYGLRCCVKDCVHRDVLTGEEAKFAFGKETTILKYMQEGRVVTPYVDEDRIIKFLYSHTR